MVSGLGQFAKKYRCFLSMVLAEAEVGVRGEIWASRDLRFYAFEAENVIKGAQLFRLT